MVECRQYAAVPIVANGPYKHPVHEVNAIRGFTVKDKNFVLQYALRREHD